MAAILATILIFGTFQYDVKATLFARSFRRSFFCVSPRCETPSYMHYLIMIKHSISPKMCRKNFENRFTNKNLMSKNVFE